MRGKRSGCARPRNSEQFVRETKKRKMNKKNETSDVKNKNQWNMENGGNEHKGHVFFSFKLKVLHGGNSLRENNIIGRRFNMAGGGMEADRWNSGREG